MTKSEILTLIEVPMLLIGFKRLDFLKVRIDEISRTTVSTLFLSLNGGTGYRLKKLITLYSGPKVSKKAW